MSSKAAKPYLGAFLLIIGASTLFTELAMGLYVYGELSHSARGWGSDTRIIGTVFSTVIAIFGLLIGLPVAFGAMGLISGGWVLMRPQKADAPAS